MNTHYCGRHRFVTRQLAPMFPLSPYLAPVFSNEKNLNLLSNNLFTLKNLVPGLNSPTVYPGNQHTNVCPALVTEVLATHNSSQLT